MKFLSFVLVAAVILSTVFALKGFNLPSFHDQPSNEMKELEKNIRIAIENKLKERRGANADDDEAYINNVINWTWSSWTAGPACNDLRKFKLVDLSEDSLKKIKDEMSSYLSIAVKSIQQQGVSCAMGLGVTYNGRIIFMDNDGTVSMESTQKPTSDTVFSIGSISKIFTSMMMNVLAEKGALDVSDPLTKYFNKDNKPEFNPPNPYDLKNGASAVTLESLSSQTSGLAREAACIALENCTEELALTMGNQFPLHHTPMTRPHYSNYGFSLLGHACERAARKQSGSPDIKYEDWIKDNILNPFNMSLSGFDYPPEIVERMAKGYTFDKGKQIVDPSFATSLGWSNPAGGMYSTLSDMMKFTTHLTQMNGVLSPNGYEQYFFAGPPMPDGISSYGKAGWEVAYANGYRTLTKGGLYAGFATTIAFIPQIKLGVFTWINIGYTYAVSSLSAQAMNFIVPIIKKEILEKQLKIEFPSIANDFVGGYYDKATNVEKLIFEKTENTDKTGIFTGKINTKNVFYKYDQLTTDAMADENAHYFRYHTYLSEGDACFMDSTAGFDDGLLIFKKDKSSNQWLASAPDALLFNLARPRSSSSVIPSSSAQPATDYTVLIIGLSVGGGVLLLLIIVFVVMYTKKVCLFKPSDNSYMNIPDPMR